MQRHTGVLSLLVIGALVTACAGKPGASTRTRAADVVLRVVVADEVVFDWTLPQLMAETSFVTLSIDGDEQNGPLMSDVLAASGIDDWDTAEVLGLGESRSFEVSLSVDADDVDDGWVFDVTNKGTLKLAADGLPREKWVRDVGEIRLP